MIRLRVLPIIFAALLIPALFCQDTRTLDSSSIGARARTIKPADTQVATPTFSPASGTYTSAQTVTISTTTSGASIRYTTDGSTPSETAGTLYSGPITVSATTTIKAIAYESGFTDSSVATATYTIQPLVAMPTFSPAAGVYPSTQTVTISTTTSGASIRYTTDGSTPTETAGALYSAPITVSASVTINAIAYASGMTDSTVATAGYTISTWYNTTWANRKPITISHSQVSGTSALTNYPMLLSVTDAALKSAANGGGVGKSDGTDILFTAADGATKLNHEIESYNPSTGQLIAWVNVPTVLPSADTVIYIYYGNAAASNQQNKNGVWDSNYMAVWHLANGTTLNATDSTANGNNGTANNVTPTAGEIDGSGGFDGSTSNISIAPSTSLSPTSAITISVWVKLNSVSGMNVPLANWDDVDGNFRTWFLWLDGTTASFYISHSGSDAPHVDNSGLSERSFGEHLVLPDGYV